MGSLTIRIPPQDLEKPPSLPEVSAGARGKNATIWVDWRYFSSARWKIILVLDDSLINTPAPRNVPTNMAVDATTSVSVWWYHTRWREIAGALTVWFTVPHQERSHIGLCPFRSRDATTSVSVWWSHTRWRSLSGTRNQEVEWEERRVDDWGWCDVYKPSGEHFIWETVEALRKPLDLNADPLHGPPPTLKPRQTVPPPPQQREEMSVKEEEHKEEAQKIKAEEEE
ncbi:hypothetical protein F4779DRAFT_615327 [Xylariaceae sp. FL0662B]|nr:hypothetical protein F4779DRAFT_615327 [Xylariaceae sp. FL0662B]